MIDVYANGKKFSGWLSARLGFSLDHIAATFSLSLAPLGDLEGLGIFPGDSCEVFCDGERVIDGFVDRLSSSFGTGLHTVEVSGSERTSDIADCSLVVPHEWTDRDAGEIVSDVCRAFGLYFSNPLGVDSGKRFSKFSAEPGGRALDVISKICRERGILVRSDGLGRVSFFRPELARRGDSLRQGENLLSARAEYSLVDRFSEYTVLGTGNPRKKVSGKASDAEVLRPRRLVIVDTNATEKDKVEARAEFEKNSRMAKSSKVEATVSGWMSGSGIWKPGVVCSVLAPALGIPCEDFLVNSVNLSWSPSEGETASLSLVPPGSYAPQPERSKKKKGKSPGKPDPWNSIRKTVRG